MENTEQNKKEIKIQRLGKEDRLHKIIPVKDSSGNVIQNLLKPLMVEVHPQDFIQIMIGSTLLSLPVAFTEEVWILGNDLPWANVIALAVLSLVFIAIFVYWQFYRELFSKYRGEFFKRVLSVYLISFSMVALFMYIIDLTPWGEDWEVALKRIIIVAFPASLSATVTDAIK